MTGQKDHPHQEEILHPVLIKPITKEHPKNMAVSVRTKKDLFQHPEVSHPIKAGNPVVINRQAALVAARAKRNPFHHEAGHIPADRPMRENRQAKKDHLHPKAGLIQAEQPIMTQGLEKAPITIGVAAKEQAIKSHSRHAVNLQAQPVPMKGQKEILHGRLRVIKNHFNHEVNHLRIHQVLVKDQKEILRGRLQVKRNPTSHVIKHLQPLATGQKEAQVAKEQVIKNLQAAHQQQGALKSGMMIKHLMPTNRNAPNQTTIK